MHSTHTKSKHDYYLHKLIVCIRRGLDGRKFADSPQWKKALYFLNAPKNTKMFSRPLAIVLRIGYTDKNRIYGKGGESMKYVCSVCGYIYDPQEGAADAGVAPGTAWENVPDDFVCPLCGVGKDQFEPES